MGHSESMTDFVAQTTTREGIPPVPAAVEATRGAKHDSPLLPTQALYGNEGRSYPIQKARIALLITVYTRINPPQRAHANSQDGGCVITAARPNCSLSPCRHSRLQSRPSSLPPFFHLFSHGLRETKGRGRRHAAGRNFELRWWRVVNVGRTNCAVERQCLRYEQADAHASGSVSRKRLFLSVTCRRRPRTLTGSPASSQMLRMDMC